MAQSFLFYYRRLGRPITENYAGVEAAALRVHWDSTPMGIWIKDGDSRHAAIEVVNGRAIGYGGDYAIELAPPPCRPTCRITEGVVGGLRPIALFAGDLFGSIAKFKAEILLCGC